MIGRLREAEPGESRVLKRATQLLHSVEATEESTLSRRRVWLSLIAEPRRIRRTRLLTRPAMAAVLVVVCLSAAVAGASVGRGLLARITTALASFSEPEPKPSLAAPRAATRSRELAQHGSVAASPLPALASDAPTPAPASGAARAASRAARAPTAGARAEPSKRSSVGADAFAAAPREEASLVLGAMTALRRDRDPARSAQMLDDYLHRYPRGVLREEALALRIEAASSLRDPALGARLAQGYLQSNPNGRFRDLAKNALSRSGEGEPKP